MKKFFWVLFFFCGMLFPLVSVFAVENPQSHSITMSATVESTSPAVIVVTGSGSIVPKSGVLIFRGYAYPEAILTLKKNGEVILVLSANQNGSFEIALSRMDLGIYTFTLGAKEIVSGELSPVFKFVLNLEEDSNIVIDRIFFPPTLHVNKSEVIQGDEIKFFGRTASNAKVILEINSHIETLSLTADSLGNWVLNYNTSNIAKGAYFLKAKSVLENLFSIYSQPIYFKVGEKNVEVINEVKLGEEQKPPIEIEIPLFPTTPIITQPEPVTPVKTKTDYSYWYLLLLLLPLLLLLEKKEIRSFGVIPTIMKDGQLLFLVVKSYHDFWTFPRGKQEPKESEIDTAFRELIEETGITQCVIEKDIYFTETYVFKHNKKRFRKINKYFLGFAQDMKVVIDKKEIIDYKWVTFEEGLKLITYEGAKTILFKANQVLMTKK